MVKSNFSIFCIVFGVTLIISLLMLIMGMFISMIFYYKIFGSYHMYSVFVKQVKDDLPKVCTNCDAWMRFNMSTSRQDLSEVQM